MKVSKSWLAQLVDLKVPMAELEELIPLRTIGTKEITDQFIELDMKGYNRADLLSMRGIAYEMAAITQSEVTFSETEASEFVWQGKDLPEVAVEVQNTDLAPVYCLAKVEGLKVQPSPAEWVDKLESAGMRPVNNIVDVTNLIMLEYGQPLHAFDTSVITDGKIVVRTATNGEELITLDNKKRTLTTEDLVIADPAKALGVAGVMGGKNSEINDQNTAIYLEAAIFNPIALRKTASRLGLSSEASKRFMHGLTKKRLLQALNAAIMMLGGQLTALTIVDHQPEQPKTLFLSLNQTIKLVGVELTAEQIEDYLKRLYFQLEQADGGWQVTVPYFRLDIEYQEDLIEEVARMYGYEKIPSQELPGQAPAKGDQSLFETIVKARRMLAELGLTEVQTPAFSSSQTFKKFNFPEGILLKLTNPISAESEHLRMSVWPNLVEVVDRNLRQGFEDVAVFELGKAYSKDEKGQPVERYVISMALSNGSDNPTAELYALASKFFAQMGVTVEEKSNPVPEFLQKLFHPNRFVKFWSRGQEVGGVSEVHPRLLFEYGISQRVAVMEIYLSCLMDK